MQEHCPGCSADTEHDVTIEIRAEGDSPHSNEPYRVAECQECGHTVTTRMNNEASVAT